MNQQRPRLRVHVGNTAQLCGGALTCYGIDRLAGLAVSLIVAGVVLAVLANFEWDASVWSVPLPLAPRKPKWMRSGLRARLSRG